MSDTRKQDTIVQTRLTVFERDGWRCQFPGCLNSSTECAHLIGQGHAQDVMDKWNQMFREQRNYRWIECNVIHSSANMRASCSNKAHNSHFNIGFNPEQIKEKLREIRAELKRTGVIK
jgi:hypothetical protein